MPMYEFRTEDGEIVELMIPFADFDKRVKDGKITLDDGRVAFYDWGQHKLTSTVPANYPMVCTAAGVHPSQIKEHTEHLREKGCGFVEHTKDGDLIFRDKNQRKKVLEALGFFDRQASYGDPQPKHLTKAGKSYRYRRLG